VQASQDLGVHTWQLCDWVKKLSDDPQHAFLGQGQMKPEQLEIAQLKREVTKLKAERDILKKSRAYFAKESTSSSVHCEAPGDFACELDVRGARCLARRLLCLLRRPCSKRSRDDEELGAKARASFLWQRSHLRRQAGVEGPCSRRCVQRTAPDWQLVTAAFKDQMFWLGHVPSETLSPAYWDLIGRA
jgi:transposase